MWRDIWERIKGAVRKVLRIGEVESKAGVKTIVDSEMAKAVELWGLMFEDRAPWLDEETESLNLAAGITSELARLVLIENKVEIAGEGARAEFLRGEYQQMVARLRERLEIGLASGTLVFKPYVDGNRLAVDFVPGWRFYPTAKNSRGEITGAVFAEQVQKGKTWYTRLEEHRLTDEGYTITNRAYKSGYAGVLGAACALSEVDDWRELTESVTVQYADGSAPEKPLFAVFRVPFANGVDVDSPLGVSVYSRAVGLIAQADAQYSRILWEYEASELAIDISEGAFRSEDGKSSLPKRGQRLFRQLNILTGAAADGDLYKVFSPAIRDESLFNGLDKLLKRIEFNCSLAYGTLSDPMSVEKTAEEIKQSKQRSFAAVKELQSALEVALRDLLWCMDFYCDLYRLCERGKWDVAFSWGDGISEDTESEFARLKALADGGYLKPEKLIAWYFGVSEEEAAGYIPLKDTAGLFDGFSFNK